MTEVKIHGYLSKIFKISCLKVYLGKLNNVLPALDSIIPNFRKKILELNSKGFTYEVKIYENTVHILPRIIGSTKFWKQYNFWWKVLGIALIIIGIVVMFFNPALGYAILQAGITMTIMAFSKRPTLPGIKGQTGGTTASTTANGRSYVFSNFKNIASQGSLIPIGYGLMKTASKIIAVSVKNYKSSDTFNQENFFRFSEPENSTFL